jgi:membrane protein DedA with SNARE-associated domain
MNLPRFVIYTFAGSLPWCLGWRMWDKSLASSGTKTTR